MTEYNFAYLPPKLLCIPIWILVIFEAIFQILQDPHQATVPYGSGRDQAAAWPQKERAGWKAACASPLVEMIYMPENCPMQAG